VDIIIGPDPRLNRQSKPVKVIDGHIIQLVSDLRSLLATTSSDRGISLSAPQVGELLQVFVIRYLGQEIVAINPEIVKTHGSHILKESCLSFPGKVYEVKRPKLVKMRYTGLDGLQHTEHAHDTLAQCLAHECDHLRGITVDQIGRLVV
jgi:peptide deformylase